MRNVASPGLHLFSRGGGEAVPKLKEAAKLQASRSLGKRMRV